MQVGCGCAVKTIKERDYLYFWWYDRSNGRSRQRWKYLGPAANERARRRAIAETEAYYVRAEQALTRDLGVLRGEMR